MLDGDRLLAEADAAEPEIDGKAAATMIYTSGTTGKPKGALRQGLGDPEQLRQMVAHIGYRPDDVYLTTGPLYHSGPGGFMLIAHILGNTVVLQRRFDPEDWLRLVAKHRVTTTFSAPTPIRMVCNLPAEVKARYDVSSMRRMIANAAPWSFALKQAYLASFPEDSLWEVYGSTELGVNAILEPKDQRRKPGSCGKPAPTVEIKLFDESGGEVTQPGVPGELFVRSKTVFSTYYKAHEKFEEDRRGELPHRRRHGLLRRRGLLLHLRPQEGHDHLGRHEHLSGRDRGGPRAPPDGRRRRRLRDPERGVGRSGARGGGGAAGPSSSRSPR